ncbi:Rrf2 family transcriptional regulator [Plasticicumulans sp.]|uniref:Rrf2 family transcriptional regulator n=1 Tax=Plasticicumulans sp. TaxID=2307179 RepID=UPI000FAF1902|nr:Rrf2 family transcriptional regulator [Plasticicumulans sp.]MBS0602221.1 Rrf2 family transcriptional regulator [Pseudomonadota bacterium]RTK98503.1 MAG: Rrf2 family transcriptional regulator [Xanthomonadales bacterium]HMV40809.1 Rrf2 family transcriptional regulator [Plasticicumulans sp.]HMW29470.1 Rrf2 family transcriptional regulator [Plasticicumulans sp.]HMW44113.1 Rrf2 family transcriptional regulator [Plasticicumulans sp.]
MKLTTKGRYAVTAMLDLALHFHGEPVVLSDISERQNLSLAYLEQLFAKLRKQGLVASTRGPGGGYSLARSADAITLAEVIEAVDESVDATRCGGLGNCHGDHQCLTHELWVELSSHIHAFLQGRTLGEMARRIGTRQPAVSTHPLRHFVQHDLRRAAGD